MVKHILSKIFFGIALFVTVFFVSTAIAASTGTIDPNGTGQYKAAFLDSGVVSNTAINFGKFTTESQYNITVSDTELRGYAWGSSVGWMVMNCADTTSGCSGANGNFKVANNNGVLSGYAWGENTGWINFGPFTDSSISTVRIDTSTGNFEGTQGTAGYAWSQNFGWIVFDCTNANTCVNTDWRPASAGGGGLSGGGSAPANPSNPVVTPTGPTTPTNPTVPTHPAGGSTTGTGSHSSGSTGPSTSTTPQEPPISSGPSGQGPTAAPIGSSEPQGNPAQSTNEPGPFDNGMNLPPSLVDAFSTIFGTIGSIVTGFIRPLVPLATGVLSAARTPIGSTVSKVASAVGVVATAAGALAILAIANPVSLTELFLLPFRLWNLLLIAFGFKKRNRPWGTVYDSVTKQPIDPAYVMLTDLQGNEVSTSITDIDGRYGFSVAPGQYKIIANKTNFVFPSQKLAGRDGDELYNNLYFGDIITIKEEGEIIAKNIPMDQLNFDWNEFAKNEQKRLSYYKRSDVTIAHISNFFFWLGFVIAAIALLASHTVYNGIVFLLYVILFIIRHYSPQFKTKGGVTDAITGEPLPFAIVHVLSAATGQEIIHKVADRLGNYYGLMPNGTYTIVIDRKNADASYTKIPVPQPVTVKDGYLQENFKV